METLNLEKIYKKEIQPKLSEELGGLNIYETPRLTKIVLNIGVGKMIATRKLQSSTKKTDEEAIKDVIEALSLIGGQRPHTIRARRSIAGFKLREGMLIGVSTTLRGQRMYDFLGRLVHIGLPRTRDFRGIPLKSVDGGGNLTIGIRDATIFPEMLQINFILRFEITLVTSTKNRDDAIILLKELGIPFQKSK